MHSSPIPLRTLLLTLLAGVLGFAAGSWRRAHGEKVAPAPASEPAPARPTASIATSPNADTASATTPEPASLRDRLKALARARNPLAAAAEAQALIATLTAEDFRELAAQPKEFPFPNPSTPGDGALFSRAYLDALVLRWLEVNPEGGAAAMRALDDGLVTTINGRTVRYGAGRDLLDALDRARPKSAAARAEDFASGRIDWRSGPMEVSKTFEELARTDPARARVLAEKISDKTVRLMAIAAVQNPSIRQSESADPVEAARASKSTKTSADAFAAAARDGPETLRAALSASKWTIINARALVAEGVIRDPDGAWDAIPGELAGKADSSISAGSKAMAQMLARQLSPEDRQRSLAAADRLAPEWRTAALEPLVGAWALEEPRAALEWVAQESERCDAAFAAFGPWLVSEADAALAWMEKSATPEVRQALAGQFTRTFEAGEKERQSSGPGAMLHRAPAEARATAAALLEHSPAAAARLVAELPMAEPAGTAFQPIFEKWLDRDAAAAAQWLEAQPASRRRDEAVAAFAAVAAPRDADGAAQWVPTIANPGLRQKAADAVFRAMELRDPATARAWRDGLPPPP